jgi:hypothetical protein
MSQILLNILVAPLVILVYGSGLLLWPLRRWRHRTQKIRGRTLAFVCIAQLVAYLVVAGCSIFIRLEHFYYWFAFLIQLNIVFTIAGLVAWSRDSRYERSLKATDSA